MYEGAEEPGVTHVCGPEEVGALVGLLEDIAAELTDAFDQFC